MGKIIRGLTFNNQLEFAYLSFDDIFEEAIKIHSPTKEVAKMLGQVLALGGYMTSEMKNSRDNMSVNVKLKEDVVFNYFGDGDFYIKASVDNNFAIQKSQITVVKDLGLKDMYTGSCFFEGGILTAFRSYFSQSEQIFVDFKIEVDFENKRLRAVFYKALPDTTGEALDYVLENIEKDVEEQKELFTKDGRTLAENQMFFKCSCNRRQIEKILISVGKKECEEIIKERGEVEVVCHFCNKKYAFDVNAIDEIFGNL